MAPVNHNVVYDESERTGDLDWKKYAKNLGNYSDSFNILLGSTNKSIDLLNNPYIKYSVY